MALRVTRANEHEVSGLSEERYCVVGDVITELRKVEQDSVNNPIGNLLDTALRDTLIGSAITDARLWVEASDQANRDFEHHESVDVYLDGSGTDAMDLSRYGFTPLLDISAVEIDGLAVDLDDDYVADARGRLRANTNNYPSVYGKEPRWGDPFWAKGTQNVTATLTWGYTSYPSDIISATALKAASLILAWIARNDTEQGDIPGGIRAIHYGNDLVVQTGEMRYAGPIKWMESEARRRCLRYRVAYVGAGVPF